MSIVIPVRYGDTVEVDTRGGGAVIALTDGYDNKRQKVLLDEDEREQLVQALTVKRPKPPRRVAILGRHHG